MCRVSFAVGDRIDISEVLQRASEAQVSGGYDGYGQGIVTEVALVPSGARTGRGGEVLGRFLHVAKRPGRPTQYGAQVRDELERKLRDDLAGLFRARFKKKVNPASIKFHFDGGWKAMHHSLRSGSWQAQIGTKRFLLRASGIGHNRWGTVGQPKEVNSHPFFVRNKRLGLNIALAHNGNFFGYKLVDKVITRHFSEFLEGKKEGQTDSETFARLVALMAQDREKNKAAALEVALDRALRLSFIIDDLRNTIDLLKRGASLGKVHEVCLKLAGHIIDSLPRERVESLRGPDLISTLENVVDLIIYGCIHKPWRCDAAKYFDLRNGIFEAVRNTAGASALAHIRETYYSGGRMSQFAIVAISNQNLNVVARKGREGGGLVVSLPDAENSVVGASESRAFEASRVKPHPNPEMAKYGFGLVDVYTIDNLCGAVTSPGGEIRFSHVETGRPIEAALSSRPIDTRNLILSEDCWLRQETYLQRTTWGRTLEHLTTKDGLPCTMTVQGLPRTMTVQGMPALRNLNYSKEDLKDITDWVIVGTGTSYTTSLAFVYAFQPYLRGVRLYVERGYEAGQEPSALAALKNYIGEYKKQHNERLLVTVVTQGGETEEIKQFLHSVISINERIEEEVTGDLIGPSLGLLYSGVLKRLGEMARKGEGARGLKDIMDKIRAWREAELEERPPSIKEIKALYLTLAKTKGIDAETAAQLSERYNKIEEKFAKHKILICAVTNVPGSTCDELVATYTIEDRGEVLRVPHSIYPLNTFEHSVAATGTATGNFLALAKLGSYVGLAKDALSESEVAGIDKRLRQGYEALKGAVIIETKKNKFEVASDLKLTLKGIVQDSFARVAEAGDIAGIPQIWLLGAGAFFAIAKEAEIKVHEVLRQDVIALDLTAGSHGAWPAASRVGSGLHIIFAPSGNRHFETAIKKLEEDRTRMDRLGTLVCVTDPEAALAERRIKAQCNVIVPMPMLDDPLVGPLMGFVFCHLFVLECAEYKYRRIEEALEAIEKELARAGALELGDTYGEVLHKFSRTRIPKRDIARETSREMQNELHNLLVEGRIESKEAGRIIEHAWRARQGSLPYREITLEMLKELKGLKEVRQDKDLMEYIETSLDRIKFRQREYEEAWALRDELRRRGIDTEALFKKFMRLTALGINVADEISFIGPTWMTDIVDKPFGIAKYVSGVL